MRKLVLVLATVLLCVSFSLETSAQMHKKSWSGYYQMLRLHDPFLQINFAPPNHHIAKTWNDLTRRERKRVKNHLKNHYGIRPSTGGYLVGTVETIGGSVFRTTVYIVTLGATAVVVGAILNNPPR